MCSAVRRSRSAVDRCSSVRDRLAHLAQQLRRGARQSRGRREEVADREVHVAELRHHPVDARLHELPPRHRSAGFDVGEVLLAPHGRADQLQLFVQLHRRVVTREQQRSMQQPVQQCRRRRQRGAIGLDEGLLFQHVERAADDPADVVSVLGLVGLVAACGDRVLRRQLRRLPTASRPRPCATSSINGPFSGEVVLENSRPNNFGRRGNWKPSSFMQLDAARRDVAGSNAPSDCCRRNFRRSSGARDSTGTPGRCRCAAGSRPKWPADRGC